MIVAMSKKKAILRILLFLQITLIFSFSLMNGELSGNTSGSLSQWLYDLLSVPFSYEIFHFSIRKCAHFTEYAVLGAIAYLNGRYAPFFGKTKATVLFFLFAVPLTDEFLQTRIPGRYGTIYDSLLDMAGYLTGVLIAYLITEKRKNS